jgi:hypothetical protein
MHVVEVIFAAHPEDFFSEGLRKPGFEVNAATLECEVCNNILHTPNLGQDSIANLVVREYLLGLVPVFETNS